MGVKAKEFLLVIFLLSSLMAFSAYSSEESANSEKQLERCLVGCKQLKEGHACMGTCVDQFDHQIGTHQGGNGGGRHPNGLRETACLKACQYAGSDIAIRYCKSKCKGHFG